MTNPYFSPPMFELNQRFKSNQNLLATFVGGTGTGKSYAALKWYETRMLQCGKKPTINHVAIGSGTEFLEIISDLPSQSMVIFDEAGVGLPSREFQSISNKILGYVLETFRRDQIAVVFTSPDFSFFDIKARKLMHYYGEMLDPNMTGLEFGHQKFMKIINNPRGDNYIFMYPTYLINGELISARPQGFIGGNVHYSLPKDEQLIKDYEEKKKLFVDSLKERAINELRRAQRRVATARELINIILQNPFKYGLGFIRIRDGLPTTRSLHYVSQIIKSQFDSEPELIKRNYLLTNDIIEQMILLTITELSPKQLKIIQMRQKNPEKTTFEVAKEVGVSRVYVSSVAPTYQVKSSKRKNILIDDEIEQTFSL